MTHLYIYDSFYQQHERTHTVALGIIAIKARTNSPKLTSQAQTRIPLGGHLTFFGRLASQLYSFDLLLLHSTQVRFVFGTVLVA